jgi:hypothetical protein
MCHSMVKNIDMTMAVVARFLLGARRVFSALVVSFSLGGAFHFQVFLAQPLVHYRLHPCHHYFRPRPLAVEVRHHRHRRHQWISRCQDRCRRLCHLV